MLDESRWSPWYSHCSKERVRFLREAGLYRIRRIGNRELDYVGETSSLRDRINTFRRCLRQKDMPYNDPHTAGPGLWALLQDDGRDSEFSFLCLGPSQAERRFRKGLECLVIWRHRQDVGQSPTLNFGRMPVGWTKSSGRAKGVRGYRESGDQRVSDRVDVISDDSDPRSNVWHGLTWLGEEMLTSSVQSVGVYRASEASGDRLTYIGQSKNVASRIRNHKSNARFSETLRWDWVDTPDLDKTERLELENDLIASHVSTFGEPPLAQFVDFLVGH